MGRLFTLVGALGTIAGLLIMVASGVALTRSFLEAVLGALAFEKGTSLAGWSVIVMGIGCIIDRLDVLDAMASNAGGTRREPKL